MAAGLRVVFDPAKDSLNREKHGLSLAFGAEVIAAGIHTAIDDRFDYGEERFVTFGRVEQRLYVAVYVIRGDVIRIISVRRASPKEVDRYG